MKKFRIADIPEDPCYGSSYNVCAPSIHATDIRFDNSTKIVLYLYWIFVTCTKAVFLQSLKYFYGTYVMLVSIGSLCIIAAQSDPALRVKLDDGYTETGAYAFHGWVNGKPYRVMHGAKCKWNLLESTSVV